jgi:hypothetical protein
VKAGMSTVSFGQRLPGFARRARVLTQQSLRVALRLRLGAWYHDRRAGAFA